MNQNWAQDLLIMYCIIQVSAFVIYLIFFTITCISVGLHPHRDHSQHIRDLKHYLKYAICFPAAWLYYGLKNAGQIAGSVAQFVASSLVGTVKVVKDMVK